MRIGIIAEGHADRAVIANIISGVTGIDKGEFVALRPADIYDETDRAAMNPAAFGSWTLVRSECQSRELIDPFLMTDDEAFVVIHMDSAEAHLYGIDHGREKTNASYEALRQLIIDQINVWLNFDLQSNILYAIAVEEIDAWILALYETGPTSRYLNVKKQLSRILAKHGIDSTSNYQNYTKLSKEFSKPKNYRTNELIDRNESLAAFCGEIRQKVVPLLSGAS